MARPGLRLHPKFKTLVRRLGEPEPHVLGHLECGWECCYQSGDAFLGSPENVEAAFEWDGEPGVFFEGVLSCGPTGFIEECPDRPGFYQVHDLWDHAPEYVQRRMEREEARKAKGKALSEIRAEAGRKGGLAKPKQTEASGGQLLPLTKQTEANVSKTEANGATPAPAPAPNKRKRALSQNSKQKRGGYGVFFEDFWSAVARHKQKSKAEAARRYAEAIAMLRNRPGVDDPHGWLKAKAQAYYTSPLGRTAYCQGPAPWLHQGGYDDDPAAWQRDRDDRPHEPVDTPYEEH